MDVTQALEKTISLDAGLSQHAHKVLEKNLQCNFQDYLKTLSDVIYRTEDQILRKAAANYMRNALISQDDFRQIESQHRWLLMQEYVRQYIKKNLFSALLTDISRPSFIAECIAAVACAEFTMSGSRWREMMIELIGDSTSVKSSKLLQAAALDAIGYICRDIRDWDKQTDVVIEVTEGIYASITYNLHQNKKHIKLAAINALSHALCWIIPNRKSEGDKRELMLMICETAKSSNISVKISAINCLIDALCDCYNSLGDFLDEEVFSILIEAMTNKKYQILVHGTWLCRRICYLEYNLLKQSRGSTRENVYPMRRCRFFSHSRLIHQLNVITQILLKYELYNEKDEDYIRESLVQCLTSLVVCYDDSFVRKFVIKFVEDNIYSDSWQNRNAAIRAYSSLVTDDVEELQILLNETLPLLIQSLTDDSNEVRAATAHVIARVCDHVANSDVFEPNLGALLRGLMKALNGKPIAATFVCHAFGRFAISIMSYDVEIHKSIRLYYDMFPQIIQKLLDTMMRTDADNDLRWAVYHCFDCLLENSSKNCYSTIQKTSEEITKRLQELLRQIEAVLLCSKYNHLISVLCITLKTFLKKLKPEDHRPICFKAVNTLLQIFNSKSFDPDAMDVKVLWSLTTFVKMLGDVFVHFMSVFRPCLIAVLKSKKKYSLLAAMSLMGEVCQVIGSKFHPCCDEVIPILLDILQDETTDRRLKQAILASIGTVAQVSGPYYRKFLRPSLRILIKMQTKLDEVHMEYSQYDRGYNLSEMHKHFLRAYIGIIQSMKNDIKTMTNLKLLLQPCILTMVRVIIHIADKRNYLPMYDATCVEVLSDLCTHFSPDIIPIMNTQTIYRLLAHARSSQNRRTKKLGIIVSEKIEKLRILD